MPMLQAWLTWPVPPPRASWAPSGMTPACRRSRTPTSCPRRRRPPLVALNSGACDIVVTDHPTGQAALTAYPDLVMLDFGGGDGDFQVSDEDINIGISMKKGNTALKDAINEVLATMTTDDYNTMMDEAISVQPLSE